MRLNNKKKTMAEVVQEPDTCTPGDMTCNSKQEKEQDPQEEPQQEPQQEQDPSTQGTQDTQGIRTIPIQLPQGSITPIQQSRTPQTPQASTQQGPGMRHLVRFLNNPEGAMANNSSKYLNTMYSSDSASLAVKSALNSRSYY